MARRGTLTRPTGNVIVLMPPYCATKAQAQGIVSALRKAIVETLEKRWKIKCRHRMTMHDLRQARIYLPLEKGPAIVAAVYSNWDGADYEQENPIVVTEWRDPVALGSAFRIVIERYTRRDHNQRDSKLTDWAAYRAYGLRSVKLFQESFQGIRIESVNEAELFYYARTQPDGEDEIELVTTLNRYGLDVEIGRRLLRLYDACLRWTWAP